MKIEKHSNPICISYIRFSTPDQIKGNSLKRQMQSSQEYAEKHGLVIEERFSYKDLGLSAYHSDHKKKGALGQLLELLESGRIPKGSVLLIESLDRLSREAVMEALSQFIQIVSKGLRIVTLMDGKEYDQHSDSGQIQYSLAVMARAYDESVTKAKRLQAAWENKRLNLDTKKLTAIAPAWLKLNRGTQQFGKIPDRCILVKRIYELYLEGNGVNKIVRLFNSEPIPAWKSKRGWHRSYIQKILHNRAVLGELQPHRMEKRQRVALGEPILDYYPKIISTDIFNRVQERMRANTTKGGKTGKISNLFSHIAKCGYCGAPMQYINKGNDDEYLTCDSVRRGRGCIRVSFRYKEIEDVFLKFCTELDVKSVLPHKTNFLDDRIASLRLEIESLSAGLSENEKKQKNIDAILGTDDSESFREALSKKLKAVYAEEQHLKTQLAETEKELESITNIEDKAEAQIKNINDLLTMLREKSGLELIAIRQKLRLEIRKLVSRIEVFPEGLRGKMLSLEEEPIRYIDIYDHSENLVYGDIVDNEIETNIGKQDFKNWQKKEKQEFENFVNDTTGKKHRRFAIWFSTGGFKEIYHEDGLFKIGFYGKKHNDMLRNIMGAVQSQPVE